ncbi:hypothetical protein D3Z36_14575 [Lachnospiraceae bacterium]|nr:hypothetical protein [Lachnospiraceae bacterium]
MQKDIKITSETPDSVIESMLVNEMPEEIKDYYAKYGYWERHIPFSAKTIKEIAGILESEKIPEEKPEEYDENITFDMLTPFPNYPFW